KLILGEEAAKEGIEGTGGLGTHELVDEGFGGEHEACEGPRPRLGIAEILLERTWGMSRAYRGNALRDLMRGRSKAVRVGARARSRGVLLRQLRASGEGLPGPLRTPPTGSVRHLPCLANAGPKSRKRKYAIARWPLWHFVMLRAQRAGECGKLHR